MRVLILFPEFKIDRQFYMTMSTNYCLIMNIILTIYSMCSYLQLNLAYLIWMSIICSKSFAIWFTKPHFSLFIQLKQHVIKLICLFIIYDWPNQSNKQTSSAPCRHNYFLSTCSTSGTSINVKCHQTRLKYACMIMIII